MTASFDYERAKVEVHRMNEAQARRLYKEARRRGDIAVMDAADDRIHALRPIGKGDVLGGLVRMMQIQETREAQEEAEKEE